MPDYDVILIGANNHTMAAAAYLGKRMGLKCLILERRKWIGAAAMTREDVPGFRMHIAATGYANYIQPDMIADLDLDKYGVNMIPLDPWLTSLYRDGTYCSIWESYDKTVQEIKEKFSQADADGYENFVNKWKMLGEMMGQGLSGPPPTFETLAGGMAAAGMEELMRDMLFMSLTRSMDQTFESPYIKDMFNAWLEGSPHSPSSPGTLFAIVGHLIVNMQWTVNKGGLGEVSNALATSAEKFGAKILTEKIVTKVLIKDGKAYGVKIESGEEYTATVVISGAEPGATFEGLVGKENVDPEYLRKATSGWYEAAGVTLNFALKELPDFKLPRERLKGFISLNCDRETAEKSFYQSKVGIIPDDPLMIGYVMSEIDPSMAPEGKYLLTVYCFPMVWKLKSGSWETTGRQEMFDKVIKSLCRYAPNIKENLIGYGGFTPLELSQEFGMTHGDHQHGSTEWGYLLGFRPIIGQEPYKTPIDNLYLCSAACQATGISGFVGRNVANLLEENWKDIKGK